MIAKHYKGILLIGVALLAITGNAFGAVTYWDFSNGDLTAASGTATMDYRDGADGPTFNGTYFLETNGTTIPHIGGTAADYMYFPKSDGTTAVPSLMGYAVTQNSGHNLTSYTVAADILIPEAIFTSTNYYTSIFNTSSLNNNDADLMFCRKTGTYQNSMFADRDDMNTKVTAPIDIMQADTWYRVVMTYNENDPNNDVCIYLNGTQVGASDASFGAPSLRLPTTITFFTDNNGDSSEGCVSSMAVCDFAMTAAEVAALGVPTVAGFNNITDHPYTPPTPPTGTSAYATAVTASNPLVYLRLNDPAGMADLSTTTNSGTSTHATATLGLSSTYPSRHPESGALGVNGLDTVAGREITGFEGDNKSYIFVPTTTASGTGLAMGSPSAISLASAYDDGGVIVNELDQDQVTYAFWIKSPTSTQAKSYLMATPDYGGVNFENDFHIILDNANGKIQLATLATTTVPETNNFVESTGDFDFSSLYDNEWHFLVAVRNGDDATNAKFYVDGEEIDLLASAQIVDVGYGHRFGTRGSGSTTDYRFTGEMDEISIWNSVLSATTIEDLFDAAAAPDDTPIPGDANKDGYVDGSDATILAGYWQQTNATWEMGDFNGDTVVDGSDATILAGYWQTGTPPGAAAVPEPATMVGLLTLLAAGFVAVRRRK